MSALLTKLKYFHFFVLVTVISGQDNSDLGPTRYDLIHYLLDVRRYDPSLPPDFYTENITTVSVELSIYDLNSESDIAMEYECTLYLRMNWTDKRLDYTANKTTYDLIDLGDTIVDKTWVPDLYFHHSRKSEMHGLFTKNQLLYLYKNGSVLYSSRFNIKWHCKMNLKHYPFDKQKCPIVIQSYSLNTDNLILKWNTGDAVRIDTGINLENIETSQKHSYHSPYDNPVGNFSTLYAEVKFSRPEQSLTIMYVAPAVIFFIVSMTSFLLGDQVVSRIGVPTGALLQIILQWTGIYNKLPASSELRLFDIWMLGNLTSVVMVLLANVMICHFWILKAKEEEKKKTEKEKESNTKDGDETKQKNLDTSKDKEEEKKNVEKAKESNAKYGDGTEQSNLDISMDKEEENIMAKKAKESSTKDSDGTKQPSLDTSKEQEEEKTNAEKAEESNTKDGDETKQSNQDTSKTESGELSKPSSSTADYTCTTENMPLLSHQLETYGSGEYAVEKDLSEDTPSVHTEDSPSVNTENMPSNESRTASNDQLPVSINMSYMKEGDECNVETEPSENYLNDLKEDFLQLLKENEDITTSTEWEVAKGILKDDPRYKRVCKNDKAPQWYTKYQKKEKKKDFLKLLDEKARTIKKWRRANMMIDHDPRFKVVVSDEVRQKWFAKYRKRKCLCIRDLLHRFYTFLNKKNSNVTVNFISCAVLGALYFLYALIFCLKWSTA